MKRTNAPRLKYYSIRVSITDAERTAAHRRGYFLNSDFVAICASANSPLPAGREYCDIEAYNLLDAKVIAVERMKEVETAIYEMRNTRELFENIRIGTFFTLQSSCTVFRKIDEENAVDCDEDDYKMKGDYIVIPIYP